MKNFIPLPLLHLSITLLIFLSLKIEKVYCQHSNFDTSYVLLSSVNSDYKNPVFYKSMSSVNYFIRECWFAYERWEGYSSDVMIRFMRFNSLSDEIEITNDSFSNLNPAIAHLDNELENNKGMLVYQSDKSGAFNIYFTLFDGQSWTASEPVFLDNEERTQPDVIVLENQFNQTYILIFRKSDGIYATKYFNDVWDNEVPLVTSSSISYTSPKLSPFFNFAFVENQQGSIEKILIGRIKLINNTITLDTILPLPHLGRQTNPRFSMGINYPLLNYDLDSNERTYAYYAAIKQTGPFYLFSINFGAEGNNFGSTGSSHGDITDASYSSLTWINQNSDSQSVMLTNNQWSWEYKGFRLSDELLEPYVNMSPKLVVPSTNRYRFRALWHDNIEGRFVIKESYSEDFLSSLTSSGNEIPKTFLLYQNFPNPFNPVTIIKFKVPEYSNEAVKLKVYNSIGQEIATLLNQHLIPGVYEYQFSGSELASGIYFYTLSSDVFSQTKRMILLK